MWHSPSEHLWGDKRSPMAREGFLGMVAELLGASISPQTGLFAGCTAPRAINPHRSVTMHWGHAAGVGPHTREVPTERCPLPGSPPPCSTSGPPRRSWSLLPLFVCSQRGAFEWGESLDN